MKSYLTRMLVLALLAFAISSCSEDNDPKVREVQQQEIEIKLKENGVEIPAETEVRGVVGVAASAPSPGNWTVLVDDDVILSEHGKEIDSEIDTRDVGDGEHIVRIQFANDKTPMIESSFPITVQNHMFSYVISAAVSHGLWVVLSNQNGTVFDYKSMEGKLQLDFDYPLDYDGKPFHLTVIEQPSERETYLRSRTYMEPGEYHAPVWQQSPTIVGDHTLNAADRESYERFQFAMVDMYAFEMNKENVKLKMTAAESPLFVWLKKPEGDPVYYYNATAKAGGSTLVNDEFISNEMKPMTLDVINIPPSMTHLISLIGTTESGKQISWISTQGEGQNGIVYYPNSEGTPFVKYRSRVSYTEVVDKYIITTSVDQEVDSPENIDLTQYNPTLISFTSADNKLAFEVSQVSDLSSVSGSIQAGNNDATWTVGFRNEKKGEFKIPQLPEELINDLQAGNLIPQIKFVVLEIGNYLSGEPFPREARSFYKNE